MQLSQLSQLSPAKMLELQEEIARAIADIDGYKFNSTTQFNSLAAYEEERDLINKYMTQAKAAIAAMKTFGVH